MPQFNVPVSLEKVHELSDAVQIWHMHYGVAPTEHSTQVLCEAVVGYYSEGHKTREELTTLLITRFHGQHSLKINAPSSSATH